MELEEVALVEPVDLAVGNRVAVADHAPQIVLGRNHLRHAGETLPQR